MQVIAHTITLLPPHVEPNDDPAVQIVINGIATVLSLPTEVNELQHVKLRLTEYYNSKSHPIDVIGLWPTISKRFSNVGPRLATGTTIYISGRMETHESLSKYNS